MHEIREAMMAVEHRKSQFEAQLDDLLVAEAEGKIPGSALDASSPGSPGSRSSSPKSGSIKKATTSIGFNKNNDSQVDPHTGHNQHGKL